MKDDEKFKKLLADDDAASRKAVLKAMTEYKVGIDPEKLKSQRLMEILNAERVRNFVIKDIACNGNLAVLYGIYRFLSSDAAHVSANSLRKHILIGEDGLKKGTDKDMPESNQISRSYEFLWVATTAVGIGFTQYVNDKKGNSDISKLIIKYTKIFSMGDI